MMGQWSLMGGFIKAGESIEEAASRVLTDCTGIDNLFMEQVGAYGDITRDLGERVISVAYYSLVNMNDFSSETLEEYNAVWAKVSEVPQLIFDHNQMITDTLARLRRKAATRPVGFQHPLQLYPNSSLFSIRYLLYYRKCHNIQVFPSQYQPQDAIRTDQTKTLVHVSTDNCQ